MPIGPLHIQEARKRRLAKSLTKIFNNAKTELGDFFTHIAPHSKVRKSVSIRLVKGPA